MNQRYVYAREAGARTHVPTALPPYTALMREPRLTDDVHDFLGAAAELAPGAKQRGGIASHTAAAEYVLEQFRHGRLGPQGLDLDVFEGTANAARDAPVRLAARDAVLRYLARLDASAVAERDDAPDAR